MLQSNQIKCNKRFPLSVAIKKSANLIELDKFVTEGYFVIKDLVTDTYIYPYAITNIDQSVLIGLKMKRKQKKSLFQRVSELREICLTRPQMTIYLKYR